MAIREWSGRRLVGTWIAGVAGEVVLIALPVAFFAVIVVGGISRDVFVGSRPVRTVTYDAGERPARSAAVSARIAEVEARVAAAEARAAAVEARAAEDARATAAVKAAEAAEARSQFRHSATERALVQQGIVEAREISAPSLWYQIPLAGALALYVLAIPLGLLAITFVWMIARFSGYRPPPSTT